MLIRPAAAQDAARIAAIYNHAVLHTTAVWNERTVDAAERRQWIEGRRAGGFPVLVAVCASGDVCGYASFGPWRAFEGYRQTVEHSVYVDPARHREGIGTALLSALIEEARGARKHVMIGGIDSDNAGSILLHQRLGFVAVGQLPEVGSKFGRWLDLTFMQLTLADVPLAP